MRFLEVWTAWNLIGGPTFSAILPRSAAGNGSVRALDVTRGLLMSGRSPDFSSQK
jgi:hypothetical protein